MEYKKKKCVQCGDKFTPTSGRQKYCSDICKGNAVQLQTSNRQKKFYQKNKELVKERIKKHDEETGYQKEYQKTDAFKRSKRRHYLNNKEYYHEKTREYRERAKNKNEQNNS